MKYIICLLFLLLPGFANAQSWKYLAKSADGETTVYYDPSSIKKKGKFIKVWTMTSYSKPQMFNSISYRSDINLNLFNCADEKVAIAYISLHSGLMGNGSTLYSYSVADHNLDWSYYVPGSLMTPLIKRVCAY